MSAPAGRNLARGGAAHAVVSASTVPSPRRDSRSRSRWSRRWPGRWPAASISPIWGSVVLNLAYSNLAREVWLEAGLDPHVPSFTTIMQCSTSMVAAFEAAGSPGLRAGTLALAGGVESMSRVQIGLGQNLSDWIRRLGQARLRREGSAPSPRSGRGTSGSPIPEIKNRVTGKSMGEHCEEMARDVEDRAPRAGRAGARAAIEGRSPRRMPASSTISSCRWTASRATRFPRRETSLEKLAALRPAFDRSSGHGTLTAGNSSPLTDRRRRPLDRDGRRALAPARAACRARGSVDFEIAAVDLFREGLLDGAGRRDPAHARAPGPPATRTSPSGRSTRRSRPRSCAT